MAESWRVCMICTIGPIAHVLAGALRELGHEPVALVAPRPAPRTVAGAAHRRTVGDDPEQVDPQARRTLFRNL